MRKTHEAREQQLNKEAPVVVEPTAGNRVVQMPRPHSVGQMRLVQTPDNVVCFAGRRWGKTQAGVYRILRGSMRRPGLYWWVGLTWKSASMKRAWRLLKTYTRAFCGAAGIPWEHVLREQSKEIWLPNGSSIWLRTAERPDSLAGEGIRGVVLDEFSLMREHVWTEYVEAALLDHGGWAMFTGVPKGENWAAALWDMAERTDGWRAERFTSYDNPFVDPANIDAIKQRTPGPLFAQEYMAERTAGDDGTIPLEWVLRANDRWREWYNGGRKLESPLTALGVDVADGGKDRTILAPRHDMIVPDLWDKTQPKAGLTMEIADYVAGRIGRTSAVAVVDSIGVGAGVVSRLRQLNVKTISFNASEGTKLKDKSGQFGFINSRSAAWWNMRELLHPETGKDIALPPEAGLLRQLTAPRWDVRAGGRIAVESKDNIRKRLGESTDYADAVIQAFWAEKRIITGKLFV